MIAPSLPELGNRAAFRFPTPPASMEATGERYVSWLVGDIQSEHYHRYLFALRFCAGRDVLDVASGEGYGSALLGQTAHSVIGVDVDAASVDFANTHYLSDRVSFRRGDATALPIADASVDVVVSFETIEHLADHAAFLSEIRRVLRPCGVLVISSPDKTIYSDAAQHENRYHLKELHRAEFLTLLRGTFPQVVLLEQRAVHGSVILRAPETGGGAEIEGFDTRDGTLFERTAGVPAAPYLVAVCALDKAPAVPDSVMNTPRLLWHMEEMRQRAEEARDSLARDLRLVREARDSLARDLRLVREDMTRQLETVLLSTSWRVTAPLRTVMTRMPGTARFARRGLKAAWWLVTGQLPARLRARRAPAWPARRDRPADAAQAVALFDPAAVADGRREWTTLAPMRVRLAAQEAERRAAAAPRPVPLVEVGEAELERVLGGLSFPATQAPVVSILVPVFNNIQMTAECLLSVRRHTDGSIPYEVILADDASTDRTRELLSGVPGLVYRRNVTNLHFLRNCNVAATAARGQFLLLLNNDVQVTEGWLPPLLEAFHADPRCGAAGPRILYPSGHLQEAGVRIEPDASATMLGLNDNPALARYGFNRRVDYCSGAALMFRRTIWEELGGFDESLAPAYCEDMEICLRLRDAGREIWYVASSTVVHHLSRTTAAESSEGKLRMVVANRQKVAERWQSLIDRLNDVRIFAFYLPQFHPIPENDRWWGRGFTEWTNVTRAVPQYSGHYQPQLPGGLGFYDLRLPEVMEAQAELARRYGIEAFCFYYYWFAGKRLLEQPIEAMLATGKPDFPFFLCWANENWSRRWDGREAEVLMAQQHSPEDDEDVIRDMIRYMRDPRYVRVRGRPLLMVYRVELFPDFAATARRWRKICRAEGIGDIFLAYVESFEFTRNNDGLFRYGLDASVQFPPHGDPVPNDAVQATAQPGFAGHVFDYEASALKFAGQPMPPWPRFPGVIPAWDNTARRMEAASIFHGSTPGAFQAWLETAIEQTRAHNAPGERIVFVNAWNEWAEGAQLEPDRVFGHARLEAVRAARRRHFLGPTEDA